MMISHIAAFPKGGKSAAAPKWYFWVIDNAIFGMI